MKTRTVLGFPCGYCSAPYATITPAPTLYCALLGYILQVLSHNKIHSALRISSSMLLRYTISCVAVFTTRYRILTHMQRYPSIPHISNIRYHNSHSVLTNLKKSVTALRGVYSKALSICYRFSSETTSQRNHTLLWYAFYHDILRKGIYRCLSAISIPFK